MAKMFPNPQLLCAHQHSPRDASECPLDQQSSEPCFWYHRAQGERHVSNVLRRHGQIGLDLKVLWFSVFDTKREH